MPNHTSLPLILILALHVAASAQSTPAAQPPACVEPPPGTVVGTCAALKLDASNIRKSVHPGDIWIDCEENYGGHGTAGFGVAAFYVNDAKPYWDDEIFEHLAALKARMSPGEYEKIALQQKAWQSNRPQLKRKATPSVGYEGGTAAMYLASMKTAGVARHRALTLGCLLEKMPNGGSSAASSPKP